MKQMNKKGVEMTVGVIIAFILGLFVLGILIFIIQQQVTQSSKGYTEIRESVTGTGCSNLLEGRSCMPSPCPTPPAPTTPPAPAGLTYKDLGPDWPDCKEKTQKSQTTKNPTTYNCCQKIEP